VIFSQVHWSRTIGSPNDLTVTSVQCGAVFETVSPMAISARTPSIQLSVSGSDSEAGNVLSRHPFIEVSMEAVIDTTVMKW
jgi:hypothetical protein